MWTNNNRGRYDRSKLRYPSDVTDDEWGLIRPLIPPAKRGGNKRTVDEREVVNGLMYILSTGVPVGVATEGPAAAQHRE
jgi:transposase